MLLIPRHQLLPILAYSLIFPISNWLGGISATIGLILSLPFVPGAWIAGLAVVSLTGNESTYLLGAFLGIFLQVWLVVTYRSLFRKKRVQVDRDPDQR